LEWKGLKKIEIDKPKSSKHTKSNF